MASADVAHGAFIAEAMHFQAKLLQCCPRVCRRGRQAAPAVVWGRLAFLLRAKRGLMQNRYRYRTVDVIVEVPD